MTDEARQKTENPKWKVVVDRIEDEIATLVLYDDDSVQFNLPAKYLPEGSKDGDQFQVTFKKDKVGRGAEKQKADDLLKDLLGQNEAPEKPS
jgi:hypothetical protein